MLQILTFNINSILISQARHSGSVFTTSSNSALLRFLYRVKHPSITSTIMHSNSIAFPSSCLLSPESFFLSFVFPPPYRPSSSAAKVSFSLDPCLRYCSPEMTNQQPSSMSQSSDIFSLGLMIAELACCSSGDASCFPLVSPTLGMFDKKAHHQEVFLHFIPLIISN